MLDFSENEDGYVQSLIDREADSDETYNTVKISQTFEATIKTGTYHDEDEAEELGDGFELDGALRETVKVLKNYMEGGKLPKYTVQKLLRRLERFECMCTEYEAGYRAPEYEPGDDE